MKTVEETICTGAEILIKSLIVNETEVIFGSQSASFLRLADSLQSCEELQPMILTHEQATIHAADGYARACGKIGVAFIPTGSGITNAITGIATAQADSVPLVIITCDDTSNTSGWKQNHEVNVFGMTTPIVKYHFLVTDARELQDIVLKAFSIASEGRPGSVIIEISEEILMMKAPYESKESIEDKPKFIRKKTPVPVLELVNNAIYTAKKPILLVGGGVTIADAAKVVKELAEKAKIPVVCTLMGIGSFPGDHALYLGMVGMHGTFAANKAVHQSDLLICLGVRFSDRVTGKISGFSPKSKKIQIDIDPSEINKNVPVDIPIVGDLNEVLEQINMNVIAGDTHEWTNEVSKWQKIAPRFSNVKSELKPQQVIQLLDHHSDANTIVATDVGQHQIWTALYYKFSNPRLLLTSGGLGTMGYGLPAAIGASITSKGKEVICISGDGSFQMNFQELITIAKHQLPVKIAILRNGYLGMVRQWQEMFYKGRYSQVKISSPDFVTLAEAYGIQGFRANNLTDAEKIIIEAFSHSNPTIMEFDITEEENVYPIVPPGGINAEAIINHS